MNKRIAINERQAQDVLDYLISESFVPSCEKTLIIKDYLDKNFARQSLDDVDTNGYPKKVPVVAMLSSDGQPLKTLQMDELLLLLIDKFQNIIKEKDDLKAFLQQVVKDWFMKRIDKSGLLSVNHV